MGFQLELHIYNTTYTITCCNQGITEFDDSDLKILTNDLILFRGKKFVTYEYKRTYSLITNSWFHRWQVTLKGDTK